MLTKDELNQLCRTRGLSDFAIATINQIRISLPSRIVRSGTHNVMTHYASRKMGCVIKAEARRTELAVIYEWDHDDTTYEFYDQPPQIKKLHVSKGGRRYGTSYTSDFFRIAENFIGWVECKPEGWLVGQVDKPNAQYVRDEQGHWRCPSAEAYAESVGLDFVVRSSAESDPIVTQNISDLSDYYWDDCPSASKEELLTAQNLLGDAGWAWLRDLLANEAGLSADAIFKMIADEQLFVDLTTFPMMKEPHRMRVFRTKALMDSGHLWLPPMLAKQELAIHQLELTPGSVILWDGKSCEILNIGTSEVFLRMPDNVMRQLPLQEFDRLTRSGQIQGTDVVADPRVAQASARLRRATATDMASAMHRYYCIHPEMCPSGKVHKASDRAIRKWRSLARRGQAEFGNEFIGLIPTLYKRGNRKRRFCQKTLDIMHRVIEDDVKAKTAPDQSTSWSMVVEYCRQEGLMAPSLKSFRAEIRRLVSPEEFKKAREGEKAGYDLELPYISIERETPRHGARPFDIGHIDHTAPDVQLVNEANGTPMGKAWLTVMIDAYTRKILAWVITFDEPSYRSCMLVIRDCVRRHGRLPATIVVDQGSEFISVYFDQLLAIFNIHKRMRPASHPRFGSIVERFFGVKNTEFTHVLRGNNKALQTPRRMSPTHDPRTLAVWNLRAFREAFEQFLDEVYHQLEHPALGVNPKTAMEIGIAQSGARRHTWISYDREFMILTMPTSDKGTSTIQRDGSFKVNKIDYFSAALVDHVGQQLAVRYDPFDLSRAYAMGKSGWIEASSMYQGELVGRTEKEISVISQEIDAINKRSGIREKNRGGILGAYLVQLRSREASLALQVQQARDQEMRSADEQAGLLSRSANDGGDYPLPPNKKTQKVTDCTEVGTMFDSISQDSYEDF